MDAMVIVRRALRSLLHKGALARALAVMAVAVLALSLMAAAAQDGDPPSLRAFPDQDTVDGWNWPADASVQLAVDGYVFPSSTADKNGSVWFGLGGYGYDLQGGQTLTMTDGNITVVYKVKTLLVSGFDLGAQTVSGSVDLENPPTPETVHVFVGQEVQAHVDTDEHGNWTAPLPTPVLAPGVCGNAEAWGVGGGSTIVDWCVPTPPPSPWLIAFPENEAVEAWNWPAGATLYLSIDSQGEDGDPELTREVTLPPADQYSGVVRIEFGDSPYDMMAGDVVTVTDNVMPPQTHVVQNLSVTEVNMAANTVAGTAGTGAVVQVWPHGSDPTAIVELVVDGTGTWLADFTGKYVMGADTCGRSRILDIAGNSTAVDWCVPNPRFTVFPEWEYVEAWDWPLGTMVTATVDHPDTPETVDCTESAPSAHPDWDPIAKVAQIQFQDCDIQAGDEVVVSGGAASKDLTVTNLAVTRIDPLEDVVAGTGKADESVYVWPHETGQQKEVTAAGGVWEVDFTDAYDIVPGSGGRAQQVDGDGDVTAVDWYLPVPKIIAQITDDWIWAQEFTPSSELTFWVNDVAHGKIVLGPEKMQADADGYAFLELRDYPFNNLVPGNQVVVTDGWMTHELTLEAITFDLFDLTEGLLAGTAPGPFGREVWVGIGLEDGEWSSNPTSGDDGTWSTSFGGPVPINYQWVSAEVFDEDGDASEVRPAVIRGEVGIDILPGIRPNLFACRLTSASLPVAVLSGVGFDATQLDTDSIRFGKTGTEAPVLRTGRNQRPLTYAMDVNRDGLKDMVFVFRFGDTGFSCADIPAGQRFANVEGTLSGTWGVMEVSGVDVLRLFRLFGR